MARGLRVEKRKHHEKNATSRTGGLIMSLMTCKTVARAIAHIGRRQYLCWQYLAAIKHCPTSTTVCTLSISTFWIFCAFYRRLNVSDYSVSNSTYVVPGVVLDNDVIAVKPRDCRARISVSATEQLNVRRLHLDTMWRPHVHCRYSAADSQYTQYSSLTPVLVSISSCQHDLLSLDRNRDS